MSDAGFPDTLGGPQSVATGANGQRVGLLTIGEVARRSGFTVKALRFHKCRGGPAAGQSSARAATASIAKG